MRVVLATGNADKVRELRTIFSDLPIDWMSLCDYPGVALPEETGATFAANARLKAEAVARALESWALADDSGLCVDALGGAPGVHSARYAGGLGIAGDNTLKLLTNLKYVDSERRQAHFFCAMALAGPGGEIHETEGRCDGVVADTPRGCGGFGYDPVFLLPALGRTMAELSPQEKQRISHRGRAAAAMRTVLARLLP